jgi:hypothetical protein
MTMKKLVKILFSAASISTAILTLTTVIYFTLIDSQKTSFSQYLMDSLKFYAMTALGVGIVTGVLFGSMWMFSKLYSKIFKEEE